MNKQTIIIDGNSFPDLETFYTEIDKLFTKDFDWQTGHNLDAFNDLLRGGFGIYEYGEPIKLLWCNFSKSYDNLGKELIDKLVEIIKCHNHIEFITS